MEMIPMENQVPRKEVEALEISPELAALREEILTRGEEVRREKAEGKKGKDLSYDYHYAFLGLEDVERLDEEDAEMVARVRSAETPDEFLETARAFDRYVTSARQASKPNAFASLLFQELYNRAFAKMGEEVTLKMFDEVSGAKKKAA
jgi:hypothetical protein